MQASSVMVQSPRLRDVIAETTGLRLGPGSRGDLQRALEAAGEELGFENAGAFAASLLERGASEAHVQALARQLTVGETYFFRDKKVFAAIAQTVLPELVRRRRGGQQRLRVWSAGCSSGEEAYSLAILVRQALPDLADWRVTVLGTDINLDA